MNEEEEKEAEENISKVEVVAIRNKMVWEILQVSKLWLWLWLL